MKPPTGIEELLESVVHREEKINLPISGTESEVAGMISATSSMNTVRESRTVIPAGSEHVGER